MICSRVVVALVLSQLLVDVCRSLINRRDNRACGGIRLLAHIDGIGGQTHDALLACSQILLKYAAWGRLLTARGDFQGSTAPVTHSEQILENLQAPHQSVK